MKIHNQTREIAWKTQNGTSTTKKKNHPEGKIQFGGQYTSATGSFQFSLNPSHFILPFTLQLKQSYRVAYPKFKS